MLGDELAAGGHADRAHDQPLVAAVRVRDDECELLSVGRESGRMREPMRGRRGDRLSRGKLDNLHLGAVTVLVAAALYVCGVPPAGGNRRLCGGRQRGQAIQEGTVATH
jgi:hypothetical protein